MPAMCQRNMSTHKRLLPLFILFFGFSSLTAVETAVGQDTLRPYQLPRIGNEIDVHEAEYFQLFPDISGYHRNALSWLLQNGVFADLVPGEVHSASAHVTEAAGDSVRFFCTSNVEVHNDVRTISSAAAAVLTIYLERFEEIRTMTSPDAIASAPFLPDSLRAAVDELFEAKILPASWPSEFQDDIPSKIHVVRRDGTQLDGYLLCVTNKRLALWTGEPVFRTTAVDTAMHILYRDEIDAIRAPSREHATSILAGLFAGLMLVGQNAVGRNSELNSTDGQFVFLQMLFLAPLGTLAGVFSLPMDDVLIWDSLSSKRYSDSPIYQNMMIRPGLPPELRDILTMDAGEYFYQWPTEHLPIVSVPYQAFKMDATNWSVGVEQLWLSADGLLGLRPGITAGYEFAYLRSSEEIAGLGLQAAAAGGDDYYSAALSATARLGPVQLLAGYRAMWLPYELSVSSTVPSTGVGPRYVTTTTTTQHSTSIEQHLYFELGFEIVVWHMAFGLHRFSQLSPSASVHEVSTNYYRDETYERSQYDVPLGAFVLSMRYRF